MEKLLKSLMCILLILFFLLNSMFVYAQDDVLDNNEDNIYDENGEPLYPEYDSQLYDENGEPLYPEYDSQLYDDYGNPINPGKDISETEPSGHLSIDQKDVSTDNKFTTNNENAPWWETNILDKPYVPVIPSMNDNLLAVLGFKMVGNDPDAVTRGEAAFYLYTLSGSGFIDSNSTYFKDVNDDNVYAKYINTLYSRRISYGDESGNFRPDDKITLLEMGIAILRLAGYEKLAGYMGGYPLGYQKLIREHKLFHKIPQKENEFINEESLEQLIKNTLLLPVFGTNTVYEDGSINLNDLSDKNVLSTYFDTDQRCVRIVSTEDVALSGFAYAPEGMVNVLRNNIQESYKIDSSFNEKYVGCESYIYVQNDDDKILCCETVRKVDELRLCSADIIDVFKDLKRIDYELDKGSQVKTAKLDANTIFVYNGKMAYDLLPENFTCLNSSVYLLDWDSDNIFDIAYVENYDTLVVDFISDDYLSTWDKYAPEALIETYVPEGYGYRTVSDRENRKSYELDEKSGDYKFSVIKDGVYVSADEIKVGDLLSIAKSRDGKKITVYIGEKTISGKIDQIDFTDRTIKLGNINYEFMCEFDDISVGDAIEIYLNHFGYIGMYRRTNTELQYGYITNYVNDTDKLEDEAKMKIFTFDNKLKVYDAAKNILHNDRKTSFTDLNTYFFQTGKINHQLIKFSLNSKGQVNKIYTADTVTGYNPNEKLVFALNAHYNADGAQDGYYRTNNLAGEYILTSSVVRLNIPIDPNGNLLEDRIDTTNAYANLSYPDIKVYDAKNGAVPSVLVKTLKDWNYPPNSISYITVYKKYRTLNADGIGVNAFAGLSNNGLEEIYLCPDDFNIDFDSISPGDVLKIRRYQIDARGNRVLYRYQKIFTLQRKSNDNISLTLCADYSYNSTTQSVISDTYYSANAYHVYGKILSVSPLQTEEVAYSGIMMVIIEPLGAASPDDYWAVSLTSPGQGYFCVEYDTETKSARPMKYLSLCQGMTIFANCSLRWTATVSDIVVYKGEEGDSY